MAVRAMINSIAALMAVFYAAVMAMIMGLAVRAQIS
jgi:hypothetical protein